MSTLENTIKDEKSPSGINVYFSKWKGKTTCGVPHPTPMTLMWSFLGGFIGIYLIAYISKSYGAFPLFAPFGASAVLLYGAPAAPFSQPRNLIGGHVLSATIGVLIFNFLGSSPLTIALAVAVAISAMLFFRVVHPPAGATALIGVTASKGVYFWIISPVLIGALILLLVALVVNNLDSKRSYPDYWV